MDDTIKKQLTEAGVDLDKTMERFMNNEALYLKFLKRFLEDPNYAQLKEHISAGDYEEAFRDAHTLKGVAGNLGLDPFYTVVSALTEELRSRKYDRLDEFVQDAEENYELLTQIIRQL
ncbi:MULTISPECIES: Hpt domain-containing protein [Eisenbergiella]|uniref:Hpt domain-containing protein n=1 Tax=Eisenbergiella porci TaxID=2652274 RepID=A0A6N7VYZ9_9FIRM|nr:MULTISPECIES: Hpt domain-containing protein [Eisenbergiella]MDY2653844.1 Hpt domain-containing protein [Eisenbergiella porci]MSS88246.1 Hpt domain-containing protein [Eisenbergiella porci]